MYEERRNKVSIRNAILVVLLLTLFIFILVWLFPTKNYLNNRTSQETYANYLASLENAAKDYFTADRMPSKVGDSVKLTLGEMLEQKLVLNIEGNAKCDLNESYVEMTRMDNEYQLKVVLNCEDFKESKVASVECTNCTVAPTTPSTKPQPQAATKYTVTFDSNGGSAVSAQTITKGQKATKPADPTRSGYTFAGWTLDGKAYDFNTAVNSDIKLVAKWNKIEETNNNNNNSSNESSNDEVKYLYEYRAVSVRPEYLDWSEWTLKRDESLTPIDTTKYVNTQEIEYGTIYTGFGSSKTGKTKTIMVDVQESYIADIQDPVADYSERTISLTPNSSSTTVYGDWEYVGQEKSRTVLRHVNTATKEYRLSDIIDEVPCGDDCLYDTYYETYYVYDVYEKKATTTTTYSCPSGTDYEVGSGANLKCYQTIKSGSKTPSCNAYGSDYETVGNQCIKYGYTTVKKEKEVPVDVYYAEYYYRTRENVGKEKEFWTYAETDHDKTALGYGYKLTGKICKFVGSVKESCEDVKAE